MKLMVLSLLALFTFNACERNDDLVVFLTRDHERAQAYTGESCADIVKTASAWRKTYGADYDAARVKLQHASPRDLLAQHQAQLEATKTTVIAAIVKCVDDPDFSKWMDEARAQR